MALEKDWQIYEDAASGNTMAEQGFTNAYIIQDVNELPAIMVGKMEAFGEQRAVSTTMCVSWRRICSG